MSKTPTQWPSSPIVVTPKVKHLITRFFEISDSTDPSSGQLFAEELFSKDGLFTTHPTLVFKGHEAIASSRSKNSPVIAARAHHLLNIYAANSPATDLVVLGRFDISLKTGNTESLNFTARFVISSQVEGQDQRFDLVQVWTDGGNLKKAIEEAKNTLAQAEEAPRET